MSALRPSFFPGVPRVWQRIYDRVSAQVRDSRTITIFVMTITLIITEVLHINVQVQEGSFIKRKLFAMAYDSKLQSLQSGMVQSLLLSLSPP